MAMADLARHSRAAQPARAVSLAEIADASRLSLAYLEQLFARLRRRGLVNSVRGPGGGYRLARPAADRRWRTSSARWTSRCEARCGAPRKSTAACPEASAV